MRLNRFVYEYTIKDQQHILSFIDFIYPYSRTKHVQLELARTIAVTVKCITSQEELIEIAKLADTLAALNVRSKGRRKNYALEIGRITSKK